MPSQIRPQRPEEKMPMSYAFPDLDALIAPMGNMVLVQFRAPKKSSGGIILTDSDQEFDREKIRVARVLEFGPICFKDRDTHEDWKEGPWVKVGDFIRTPAYVGVDKWRRIIEDTDETKRRMEIWEKQCAEADSRITELVDSRHTGLTQREQNELDAMVEEKKRRSKPETAYVEIEFGLINDYDIKGRIKGDPLDIVDYI